MSAQAYPPPAPPHHCQPPRYRPQAEWRTIAPPIGFMRPQDRKTAKPIPIPTAYPDGTLWRCVCGRTWVRRAGEHYGSNPHLGHTEGRWAPVRWWQRRLLNRVVQCDFDAMAADPVAWTRREIGAES